MVCASARGHRLNLSKVGFRHITDQVMAFSVVIGLADFFFVGDSNVLAQTHGEVFPTELGELFKAGHQNAVVQLFPHLPLCLLLGIVYLADEFFEVRIVKGEDEVLGDRWPGTSSYLVEIHGFEYGRRVAVSLVDYRDVRLNHLKTVSEDRATAIRVTLGTSAECRQDIRLVIVDAFLASKKVRRPTSCPLRLLSCFISEICCCLVLWGHFRIVDFVAFKKQTSIRRVTKPSFKSYCCLAHS